jgi:HKD family nuclease
MIENFFKLIVSNLFENVSHQETLGALLKDAKSIQIICPFISKEGAEWLLRTKSQDSSVEIVTELSIAGVISGVQDPEAVQLLLDAKCKVNYVVDGLHAKVYWIDKRKVLVTSANLTRNGLKNNFEVGICLESSLMDNIQRKSSSTTLSAYIEALWNFVKRSSDPVTSVILARFLELKRDAREIRRITAALEESFESQMVGPRFERFQKENSNPQNLLTDLLRTQMFKGFKLEDWDVFGHKMDLNAENLTKFRLQLDEMINPLLRSFYLQLCNEPLFKESLGALQMGTSKQVQLTTRFPNVRYLFLTKPQKGKNPLKHIGEPSFIIGMGLSTEGTWLEVRSGVEEDRLGSLSPVGENLLRRMLSNIGEVIRHLNSMGSGWEVTHGSYSKNLQKRITAKTITRSELEDILNYYLSTHELSDFQVRRCYFLENMADREIVLSPRITSKVAKDFEKLKYFFDLAHT